MESFKEQSTKPWYNQDINLSVKLGCLQRIADATELMAKNHAQLVAERDRLVAERDRLVADREYWMDRAAKNGLSASALRGVITKLKRAQK